MRMLSGILHMLVMISFMRMLVLAEEESLPCERPEVFPNMQILREYIDCVKSLADRRYGKRSGSNNDTPKMRYRPVSRLQYGLPSQRNHKDLFEVLKQYHY